MARSDPLTDTSLVARPAPGGASLAGQSLVRPRRSLFRDAVARFSANRLAVVGLGIVVVLLLFAVFADDWFVALPLGRKVSPLLARTPYDKVFFGPSGAFPGREFWMGTDLNGRDFYSRIVYAARVSLSIAILSQLIALLIGVPLGGLAGWRGGRVDYLIMRVVDVMSAIPLLLFAFMIMARLGAGYRNVLLAIALTSWINICRLTRAQFLALREKEFVEGARMLGATSTRIILRHLLPNSMAALIVAVTFGIPSAIFAEAALSFLGVGINPPMPSWGQMIGLEGVTNMTYFWHLAFFPALMIALTMLGFTLMGDGLRDALDPRMLRTK